MRDPEHYIDPEVFRPERFLEIDPNSDFETWDPKKLVFGFGRRSGSSDSDIYVCAYISSQSVPRRASRGQ